MVGSLMLSDCEFAKSELDLYVDQIIKDNGDAVELKGGYDINNLYLSVKTLSILSMILPVLIMNMTNVKQNC